MQNWPTENLDLWEAFLIHQRAQRAFPEVHVIVEM